MFSVTRTYMETIHYIYISIIPVFKGHQGHGFNSQEEHLENHYSKW